MVRIVATLRASGPTFSPRSAERRSGRAFTEAHEPGERADRGRYRGQARPYGSGELRADPFDLSQPDAAFFPAAAALARASEAAGAETVVLHLDGAWQDQCNTEMSPALVAALAALGVPVTMSFFEHAAGTTTDGRLP